MKISGIETFVVDAGWRPWAFVKITTDEGVTGYGDCSDGRSPNGVVGTIEDLKPLLIGQDPRAFEMRFWDMIRGTRQSPGGIAAKAIAGQIRARHDWSTIYTGNAGQIVLVRRDSRGGQECAVLHHGHVIDAAQVRGSLIACRRPGGFWTLDEARWTRSGDDFAEPGGNRKPPKGRWRPVTE